jgi:hypothetical protein
MGYVNKYRRLHGVFIIFDSSGDGNIIILCCGKVKKVRGFRINISYNPSDDDSAVARVPDKFHVVDVYVYIRYRSKSGRGARLHALRNPRHSFAKMID